MVSTTAVGNPIISAWSAVSPFGLTNAEFAEGLRSGRSTAVRLDRDEWHVPFDEAHLVPGFDIRSVLGRRGTRSMDRVTGLAVAAVGRVLAHDEVERLPGIGVDTGLVLGTNTGSVQSVMDFTRDSLVGQRPYLVDPARFPNTVMNCAAGTSAIWYRLKGPNATISGGRATGLVALQYARRLLKAGRASAVLCGAVEEFSAARAWLDWHTNGRRSAVLGEGAAVCLLEDADVAQANGRPGIAEVIGLEFGFARDGEEIRPVLAGGLRRLLDRAGLGPDEVRVVADSHLPGADGEAERAAIADVLGTSGAWCVPSMEAIGDTSAASAAFQIAAVLMLAEGGGSDDGRTAALVTSAEAGGVVGAALLKLLDWPGLA